jgi:hypothetical protein
MPNRLEKKTSNSGRILMFSQRNIYEPEVWRCSFFEFEGILQQIDSVEMLAPNPKKWFKLGKRIAMRIGRDSTFVLNPGIPKIRLDKYYDLFFAVCEKPSELLNVNAVMGWKDYCRTSICWLPELWVKEMSVLKSSLEVLSKFDYVISTLAQSVGPISKVIPGKCLYLSPGVDAILFCPYPQPPKRFIDVFSIGRRSDQTHHGLLRMAQENKIFYIYDTLSDLHTYNLEQHRFLISNMTKRSRYFIVNPGKVDKPEERGNQSETGTRYFEGAAAGTIMIGEQPQNDEFKKLFFWPDAVIHLHFGSDKIDKIINELDAQPERQGKISKNNVVQTLLHHDWVYRWETVLKIAELKPMPKLLERKERLDNLSRMVEREIS